MRTTVNGKAKITNIDAQRSSQEGEQGEESNEELDSHNFPRIHEEDKVDAKGKVLCRAKPRRPRSTIATSPTHGPNHSTRTSLLHGGELLNCECERSLQHHRKRPKLPQSSYATKRTIGKIFAELIDG